MTSSSALPAGPDVADPPEGARRAVVADVRSALSIVAALAVIGALLGLVWSAWSPTGPRALVIAPGELQVDETEAFIAGDGRFLVLALAMGLLGGLLAWRRSANRGPLMPAALAVGGLVGSLLTELVGRLSSGGTRDGRTGSVIDQLPLSLHLQGLVLVQAGVAVLAYGMLVAFATRDDLGRADPLRDELLAARRPYAVAPSVRPGDQPQDGGGDGDAPGVLQQRDLPPQ